MDAAQGVVLSTSRRGRRVFVRPKGDLDFSNANALIDAMQAAVDDHVSMCVLDCEQVTFIDTETLKALLLLRHRLRRDGKDLQLHKCPRQLLRLLTLLGLHGELGCVSEPDPSC